jgi:hypothetical protein
MSDPYSIIGRKKERSMEVPYVYTIKTNLSMIEFDVIADSEFDAIRTGEVILKQVLIRDVEQGREV